MTSELTATYRSARNDAKLCVLEGLHAIKHALRFGAELEDLRANTAVDWRNIAKDLAGDVLPEIERLAVEIPDSAFMDLAPQPPHTGLIAIAYRPEFNCTGFWRSRRQGPVVILDNPSHPGNTGAVIRTAAAAGAHAVFCTGRADPWHPTTIRAAAGLHFALAVAGVREEDLPNEPLTGFDAAGVPIEEASVVSQDILVFGSERRGLSDTMRMRLSRRLSLPMREGVSSLNLAASVAAVLFHWRLSTPFELIDGHFK